MNNESEFEKRLARQRLRTLPDEWRQEILRAAGSLADSRVPIEQASSATQSSNLTLFAQLRRELINLFWPRPSAWAGLAVVWSLILGFTLADREPDSAQTLEFAAVPAPELRVALLHEQQQLLAELMGDKPGANEPEPVKPQPHSRRREEFTNV